ncbi:MAG: hypothetical protein JNK85_21405 [Verrucomicrobiales bacterium]|nr:hypothetical protein [Verrucomicrobiales bacterium]
MNRLRDPRWVLILSFLAILFGVPAVQTIREAVEEEGVLAVEAFPRSLSAAGLRTYEHTLESASWAAKASRPWFQLAQFAGLKDGGSKAIVARDGWYFYKPGLLDLVARSAPTVSPAGDTNDPVVAILHFRDQLAARGIRLVIMPVPNKESIYPDRLTARAAHLKGIIAPRTAEFQRRLNDAGVEWIDLFAAFRDARLESGAEVQPPLYLRQDTHWSPRGVALAAQTAARRLRELGWVQPGRVRYGERPAPVQRLGDILQMLQVPDLEQRVPPEAVDCIQIVQRDSGEPFRETSDAEVLLLGDSFLRVFQQDAPGSAGFAAHLARELEQPVQFLVNDGGGSTLVRQELSARPAYLTGKKVVLWEFVERDLGLGREGWKQVPLP